MTEHRSHGHSAAGNSSSTSPGPPASQTYITPHFPPGNGPRIWFLTAGDAPISVSVAQQLLEHGDCVIAGLAPTVIPGREGPREELDILAQSFPSNSPAATSAHAVAQDSSKTSHVRAEDQQQGHGANNNSISREQDGNGDMSLDNPDMLAHELNYQTEDKNERNRGQLSLVPFEISSLSSIQSAYATAVSLYGRIDVLLVANNETVIGCVEELGASTRAQSLLREQFSTNFFGPVNAIKAALSVFRQAPAPSQRPASQHSHHPRHGNSNTDLSQDLPSSANTGPTATAAPSLPQGGHIVLLTGITGHLGTPGLGAYCASQWAVEGYCDSLAYEVAPFNVRISIVQSNIEVGVLTNPIAAVPAIPGAYGIGSGSFRHEHEHEHGDEHAEDDDEYDAAMDTEGGGSGRVNKAPLARGWLGSLVGRLEDAMTATEDAEARKPDREGSRSITEGARATSIGCPPMPRPFRDALIAETVYAVLAIGGHDNPPGRHIVGNEGVTSVKEKLKTVSEELEDFVGVSMSVDLA